MRLLSEALKLDAAIEYQVLATPAPGIISRYFDMAGWCKAVFVFTLDTMAAAAQVVANIMEAPVNTGVGGAAIATATCTVTANTLATVVSVTCVTTAVGNTITINGVVFTAAAAPVHATLVWDQSGDDTADAADFVTCCNAAAAQAAFLATGLGLVTAASALGVITLTMTEAGSGTLTVAAVGAPLTVATVQAIGYIEVEDTALLAANSHVALQLIGAATTNASVACVRSSARYEPAAQAVAASDTDE